MENARLLIVIVCAFYTGVYIRTIDAPQAATPIVFHLPLPDYIPSYPPPLPSMPRWDREAFEFLPGEWPRRADQAAMLKCLKPPVRGLFDQIEARFGRVEVISTCNHSLYVAGTRKVSLHVSGMAVDFLAGDRKRAILAWLVANHAAGGTMTYDRSEHIHVDVGRHFVILAARDRGITNARQRPAMARTNERRPRSPRAARYREDAF